MLNLAHRQPTFKIFFSCRQPTFQIFFPAGNQIFKYFFAAGNKVITSLPTDNQLFKSFFLEATKFLNLFSHRQPTFLAPEISYFNYEPGSTKVDFPHDGGDDNECNILYCKSQLCSLFHERTCSRFNRLFVRLSFVTMPKIPYNPL